MSPARPVGSRAVKRERRITAGDNHAQTEVAGHRGCGVERQPVQAVRISAPGSSSAAVRMAKAAAIAAVIFMR